jgi:hypothetical protein
MIDWLADCASPRKRDGADPRRRAPRQDLLPGEGLNVWVRSLPVLDSRLLFS